MTLTGEKMLPPPPPVKPKWMLVPLEELKAHTRDLVVNTVRYDEFWLLGEKLTFEEAMADARVDIQQHIANQAIEEALLKIRLWSQKTCWLLTGTRELAAWLQNSAWELSRYLEKE